MFYRHVLFAWCYCYTTYTLIKYRNGNKRTVSIKLFLRSPEPTCRWCAHALRVCTVETMFFKHPIISTHDVVQFFIRLNFHPTHVNRVLVTAITVGEPHPLYYTNRSRNRDRDSVVCQVYYKLCADRKQCIHQGHTWNITKFNFNNNSLQLFWNANDHLSVFGEWLVTPSMSRIRRIWYFEFSIWKWRHKPITTDETPINIENGHEDTCKWRFVKMPSKETLNTRMYVYEGKGKISGAD